MAYGSGDRTVSDTPTTEDIPTRKVVVDVPEDATPEELDRLKQAFFKKLTGKDLPPR